MLEALYYIYNGFTCTHCRGAIASPCPWLDRYSERTNSSGLAERDRVCDHCRACGHGLARDSPLTGLAACSRANVRLSRGCNATRGQRGGVTARHRARLAVRENKLTSSAITEAHYVPWEIVMPTIGRFALAAALLLIFAGPYGGPATARSMARYASRHSTISWRGSSEASSPRAMLFSGQTYRDYG